MSNYLSTTVCVVAALVATGPNEGQDVAAAVLDIDARLFLSFGELETEDRMRNPVRRLDSLLRDGRRSKLTCTLHTFADETHGSVVPATFRRGLREVFKR